MSEANQDAGPFPSFQQMQREHLDLMKGQHASGEDAASVSARAKAFIERVKQTGAVLSDDNERKAAQNILEYWSASSASFEISDTKEWTLPKLDEYRAPATEAVAVPSSEASTDAKMARRGIQLSATARLWKDAGRSAGYLLNGRALEEAEKYAGDPDVAELVKASKAAVRSSLIIRSLGASVAVLLLAFAALLFYLLFYIQVTSQALQDAQNAVVANQSAGKLTAQVSEQQAQISALTAELNKARIAVPSEISETLPNSVAQAAVKKDPNRPGPTQPAVQRGWIWIGSTADPNLTDPKTLAPVKPGDVTSGTDYKVTRNLVLRSERPTDNTYIQSEGIGVVPQQTTIRVIEKPTRYFRPSYKSADQNKASYQAPAPSDDVGPAGTTAQYWALVEMGAGDQPIIYIEYTGSAQTANALAQRLKAANFRVAGIENTDLAKGLNETRYYHDEKDAAKDLVAAVSAAAGELRLTKLPPVKASDLSSQAGSRNFPGVLELWIDLSSAP